MSRNLRQSKMYNFRRYYSLKIRCDAYNSLHELLCSHTEAIKPKNKQYISSAMNAIREEIGEIGELPSIATIIAKIDAFCYNNLSKLEDNYEFEIDKTKVLITNFYNENFETEIDLTMKIKNEIIINHKLKFNQKKHGTDK